MKTRKIAIIATTLLLALALPALSIPKANAFHSSWDVRMSGLVATAYSDPFFAPSTVFAAREGSTVNFNVEIVAGSSTGQRNITIGVKMDWMTTFQNASGARPTQTMPLQPNQMGFATIGVAIPAVSGFYSSINLVLHTWEVRAWNGPANTTATSGYISWPGSNFAIYANAQADGVVARQQADPEITALTSILSGLIQLPPGAAKASSELGQAKAELTLGDTSYKLLDFATAKTHYTNALNLANSAASDLSTQGGGVDSASFWQLILNGTGVLLVGVGVVLAAVGSWMYLRKRSTATMLK